MTDIRVDLLGPKMPEHPLMACGHVAQGYDKASGAPVCVICVGIDPRATQPAETKPDLTGRIARCSYNRGGGCHGNYRCESCDQPSSFSLAFFEYHGPGSQRPAEYDEYYCGCFGWD